MSGHSRWSQIKHKKGLADQKRGNLFSKLSKVISLAAKKGADPAINIELKNAIDQARSFNMPGDSIQRAISRAKDKDIARLYPIQMEVIGPSGSAFIIEGITDNSNRTIGELKTIIKSHGMKMVPPHSLSWMFVKRSGELVPKNIVRISPAEKSAVESFLNEIDGHNDVKDICSNIAMDD